MPIIKTLILLFIVVAAVGTAIAARGPLSLGMGLGLSTGGAASAAYENLTIDSDPLLMDGSNLRTQQ